MKLVIDIPKDVKETLDRIESLSIKQLGDLQVAVMHGTPLPKEHGRLVDMSEVIVKLMQYYDRDKTIGQCLDEVRTVIEADWGDVE